MWLSECMRMRSSGWGGENRVVTDSEGDHERVKEDDLMAQRRRITRERRTTYIQWRRRRQWRESKKGRNGTRKDTRQFWSLRMMRAMWSWNVCNRIRDADVIHEGDGACRGSVVQSAEVKGWLCDHVVERRWMLRSERGNEYVRDISSEKTQKCTVHDAWASIRSYHQVSRRSTLRLPVMNTKWWEGRWMVQEIWNRNPKNPSVELAGWDCRQ